jgi:hypothetical protein
LTRRQYNTVKTVITKMLSFCTFSFGHCVVCSSSIYGFWLRLWYLQALLKVRIYWPDKVIWTEDLVQVQNMCYTFLMYNFSRVFFANYYAYSFGSIFWWLFETAWTDIFLFGTTNIH